MVNDKQIHSTATIMSTFKIFSHHPFKKLNMEYYTSLSQNAEIRAVAVSENEDWTFNFTTTNETRWYKNLMHKKSPQLLKQLKHRHTFSHSLIEGEPIMAKSHSLEIKYLTGKGNSHESLGWCGFPKCLQAKNDHTFHRSSSWRDESNFS